MWRWGRFLFLIAGIIGLGFYYLYLDFKKEIKKDEDISQKKIFLLKEGQEVSGLSVKNRAGQEIRLKKENGRWQITEPIQYAADEFIVDGLLLALRTTTWNRQFSAGMFEPKEIGLDFPAQRIGVATDMTAETWRYLALGGKTPAGDFTYGKWEDDPFVILLHEQFVRAFDKSVYSLRNKKVFGVLPEKIEEVDLKLEGLELAAFLKNGEWRSRKQADAVYRTDALRALLGEISGLYVRDFFDEINAENPDAGLRSDKSYIRVKDRDGQAVKLWLGKLNEERQGLYALKDGEKTVLLVPDAIVNRVVSQLQELTRQGTVDAGSQAGNVDPDIIMEPVKPVAKKSVSVPRTQDEDVLFEPVAPALPPEKPLAAEALFASDPEEEKAAPAVSSLVVENGQAIAEVKESVEQALQKTPPLPANIDFSKVKQISLKKLGTEIRLRSAEGKWVFEIDEGVRPEKLHETVEKLKAYISGISFTEAVDESHLPRVPYTITVKFFAEDNTLPAQYTFYKKREEILGQMSAQSGLYTLPAEVWQDLEGFLREILSCKKF